MMAVINFQVNGLVQEALASRKGEGMVTSPFLRDGGGEFPSQWFGSRGIASVPLTYCQFDITICTCDLNGTKISG